MIEKFLNWWYFVMPAIGLAPVHDDDDEKEGEE
jgi:hypothetical protein